MRITLTFIAYCLLQISCYRVAAQDIHFKLIEPPKVESWGLITDMTQDSTGFMWISTWNGLHRYDGLRYTAYTHNPLDTNSLAGDRTECVFADKDRYVYVGTFGYGLDQLNPLTGVFKHFTHNKNDPNSLSNDTITAIIKDRNGLLWVGTANGLNEFDPQTGKCKRFIHDDKDSTSISENDVRIIYQDKEGIIWLGTKEPFPAFAKQQMGGLNRYDPKTGKFTRYLHDPNNASSLIDNAVTAIFEDSHGNLLIGTTGDGLHIMNRQTGTFQRMPYDPKHPEIMSRPSQLNNHPQAVIDHISFITEDKLGNIWIGTIENGINVYDPVKKTTTHFGSLESNSRKLVNNEFWRAFKSREGIMWVSSWSASGEPLSLYQVNPFEYKLARTRVGYFAMCFLENADGSLWIGTDSCLLKQNADGSIEQYPVKIAGKLTGSQNFVSSIVADSKGNLWTAPSGGLQYFDTATKMYNGYFHKESNPASLGCDSVSVLEDAGNNKLWVGTLNGLDLFDISSGVFTHYKNNPNDSNSINNKYILCIQKLKNGDVLIGGNNAIDRLNTKTGNFTHYKMNLIVYNLSLDQEGTIWAATERGLYRYNEANDLFFSYSDYPAILNSGTIVDRLAIDEKRNLYMSTRSGFIKLNTQSNEISAYGSSVGMTPADYVQRSLLVRKNGEILIMDSLDYLHFTPDKSFNNLPKPTVLITGFSLSDNIVSPGPGSVLTKPIFETEEILLSYNQDVFSFSFTTIDYSDKNENTALLYKLENYDLKWRKANSEYSASYYNVPPGHYIFKVKSTNSTGIWVEKDITVIVRPPWWKTTWAYILYAIIFVIFSLMANRIIRDRIIEKEKIKNREKELAHAKEIEKAYNDLKLTQAQLIQSEKMASLGEMTAGIAHEIQNPLNFVNNFSEVNGELIKEMKEEIDKGNIEEVKAIANDIEENEQKINHHGKRADSIVKGMLLHSRRSSGIKEPTDINGLADEYLRLSYHGLRAKDKSFNATIKTDLDETIGKINIIPQDIGRVLLNLYNNAFYAVSEKAKMHSVNYNPEVSVSIKKTGNVVEIKVKDNGNGIPQSIVDKIFQPFFTTKPTGQGTGLGLSLTYDIVKAHGGEIKVETKENEWTEFIIYLQTRS